MKTKRFINKHRQSKKSRQTTNEMSEQKPPVVTPGVSPEVATGVKLSKKIYSAFIILYWEQKNNISSISDKYLYVVGHFTSKDKATLELEKSKDLCRTNECFIANLMDFLLSGFTVKIETHITLIDINASVPYRDPNNVYTIKGYKGLTNNLSILDQIEKVTDHRRQIITLDMNIFNVNKAENFNAWL